MADDFDPTAGIFDLLESDDDVWAEGWLDRNYGGAPDECSACFRSGKIVNQADCKIH